MRLSEIAHGGQAVPIGLIGSDKELSIQIQERLAALGILDPPADGIFGQVSHWGLGQFLAGIDRADAKALDADAARLLLGTGEAAGLPIALGKDLASRVVSAMLDMGHWLCRVPGAVNIVYVEGMDPDGKKNGNLPNQFNDTRMVISFNRKGVPQLSGSWDGTTEPGRYYTELAPLDPRGAARVAFGQFKAWSIGTHGGSSPHEALVQTAEIPVYRDLDKDYKRDHDKLYPPGMFGINQHWGFDMAKGNIGNASAGCLVGRTKAGHREFMDICRADPRHEVSKGYKFMTTVLPARVVPEAQ